MNIKNIIKHHSGTLINDFSNNDVKIKNHVLDKSIITAISKNGDIKGK